MKNYTEFNLLVKLDNEELKTLNNIAERRKLFLKEHGIDNVDDIIPESILLGMIYRGLKEDYNDIK